MARRRHEIAFELAGRVGTSFGGMFKSANTHFSRLKQNISRMQLDIKELNRDYKNGKISAERYADAHGKLSAQLEKAERSQQRLNRAVETHKKVSEFRNSMRGQMLDNIARVTMAATPVKMAMDYESAFAGVRKTVDATEAEFAVLSDGIRTMAKEIPAAATEIAGVAEAAGQLGIEKESIMGFTRTMVDLGVATNMTSEEAATALARFASITNMSQKDFDRLGSSIVELGNNFATTEKEIVDMAMRLAGAGAQVGMTEADIMALATALSSVGIEAEMGGSAMSRVMVNMQVATSTGMKKVEDISKKTGMTLRELQMLAVNNSMDFTDLADSLGMTRTELKNIVDAGVDLEGFAKVAGMTRDEFVKAFEKDAIGALGAFINGLANAEEAGESAINMLQEMGITEIRLRDSLLRAGGANELFANAVKLSTEAWEENVALTKEAEERYKTSASQLQIFKNRVTDLGITVGNLLLPPLNSMLEKVGNIAEKAQAFAEKYPNLTTALVYGTTAVLGIGVAFTTAGYAISLMVTPFTSVMKLIAKLRTYPALANRAAKETMKWATATQALGGGAMIGGDMIDGGMIGGGKGKGKGRGKRKGIFGLGRKGKSTGGKVVAKSLGKPVISPKAFAKRIPFAGALFSAFDIFSAEGAKEKGRAIGGTAGSIAGGSVGALLGPLGALGGAIAGDFLGRKIGGAVVDLKNAIGETLPEVKRFSDEVSDSTQKAVGAFLDLNDAATVSLNELTWSGKELTDEMADKLISTYKQMSDQILKEMSNHHSEQTSSMNSLFAQAEGMSEEHKNSIAEKVKQGQEQERQKVEEGQQKIEEVIKKSKEEHGRITDEARTEVNRIQDEMVRTGIRVLSENELEQAAILERMKTNASVLSAQQAAEVVRNSVAQKEQTVAEAEEQYNEVVKWAIEQRDVTGTISNEEAQEIINEAERQKNEVIGHAEEMHEKVVQEAQNQADEHIAKVNWETGEVLGEWETFKTGIEKIFEDLRTAARNTWDAVANAFRPPDEESRAAKFGTKGDSRVHGPMLPDGSFAVGTSRVPRDMIAQIHKDEMVIPAAQSRTLRSRGFGIHNITDIGKESFTQLPSDFGSSNKQEINVTYAPVIYGNNKQEIQSVLEQDKRNFNEQLNEILHQNKRVSFT